MLKANFCNFRMDMQRGRWIFNGTMDRYVLSGRYIGKGRILLVPIVGDGLANFTLENLGCDFIIDGAPTKAKGKTYYKINRLRVYYKFDKCFMSLTNLFNGNKQLGKKKKN